ncbi:hypothetical protein WJX73_010777 [Symbiochloris irregularis]|uniref:Cupin type-1 domain-containing protein n=1 Tax=Symbiochloris irregularis TaxID=706552 RepID=A0AAW1NVE5_9CHLO
MYFACDAGLVGKGPQPFETGVGNYNGTFAFQEFPGGSQQALYYDNEIPIPTVTGFYAQMVNITACGFSSPHYHPGISELNYVLEGDGAIAGLLLQSDATGTLATWATGLSKGGIATVPPNSIHYAENPGCGNVALLQVFSKLPDNYEYLPYVDLTTALLSQDATAIQWSYGLTAEGLQNAIKTVKPLFAVNATCLAACEASGAISPSGSPSSTQAGK